MKQSETVCRKYMEVSYAYQKLDNLPDGYSVPEGRVKPWGTAHAVLELHRSGRMDHLQSSMRMIITGVEAFQLIYDYLDNSIRMMINYRYTMVGYILG